MEDFKFEDELECLKASYDSTEFSYAILSNTPVLKFNLGYGAIVTFEIPPTYPLSSPFISLSTNELTNAERIKLENEMRRFALENVGYPMVMDLVTKCHQLLDEYSKRNIVVDKAKGSENNSIHLAVILIDHMRQKKKYSDTLLSWASELSTSGCLLFYLRWNFLLLEGCKRYIKEFMTRLKTVCIDVDSSGKPCKEKMSTVLYEGISDGNFTEFSLKEISSFEDMEIYFKQSGIISIFNEVIRPVVKKNR